MHSIEVIIKLNKLAKAAKEAQRAKALNNPGGHAKDVEKGRAKPSKKKECECCENLRAVKEFWRLKGINHTEFRSFCNGCRRQLKGAGWHKLNS